jgi:hypothetical protein
MTDITFSEFNEITLELLTGLINNIENTIFSDNFNINIYKKIRITVINDDKTLLIKLNTQKKKILNEKSIIDIKDIINTIFSHSSKTIENYNGLDYIMNCIGLNYNKCTEVCTNYYDYLNKDKQCNNNYAHDTHQLIIVDCKNYVHCKKPNCLHLHYAETKEFVYNKAEKLINAIKENKGKIYALCNKKEHFTENVDPTILTYCNKYHNSSEIQWNKINKCNYTKISCKKFKVSCMFQHNENQKEFGDRIDSIIRDLEKI